MAPSVCRIAVSTLTRGGFLMVDRATSTTAGICAIRDKAFLTLIAWGSDDWVSSR